jgi:hypothetical protein
VEVSPATGNLVVGTTLQLSATAFDASDVVRRDRVPQWSSSDVARATVSQAGVVTAVAAGSVTITATIDGKTGGATLTILPATGSASLVMTPGIFALAPNGTVTFSAADVRGGSPTVTWTVAGQGQTGTISQSGAYVAPSTIPSGDSVVVTATLAADPSVSVSAPVFFIPNLANRDYMITLPRVVDATRPAPVRFLVVPAAATASVSFISRANASTALTPIGNGVHTLVLDPSYLTSGYTPGTLHNPLGFLDHRDAANTRVKLVNFAAAIRESTMPDAMTTALAPDAQRSAYVLNIRADTASVNAYASVTTRALQFLGDRFDVVSIIAPVYSNNNRNYVGLRNDIGGIGAQLFNTSAAWGGQGTLRGVVSFPIADYFDGADVGSIHEVGHSWINYASADPILKATVPHWPLSTMAYGIMGFSIGGGSGGQGGTFGWTIAPAGAGTVRVNSAPDATVFTPLDLYLMGLLPKDSVTPMYVLSSVTDPSQLHDGDVLPATTYTIDDYIASQGARTPSRMPAPNVVREAIVVLSLGRLLTPAEMAFFDHAAARGETTVALKSSIGLATNVTAPGFYLATGGRATLQTRLPP